MRHTLPRFAFALAAGSPLLMLVLGLWPGGFWAPVALLWVGFATVALDWLLPFTVPDAAPDAEFPGAEPLLLALGIGALLVLALLSATLGHRGFGASSLFLILAAGLWLGQVAHPAAHELIHRPGRLARATGVTIYAALLIGHHASAHRLVHHALVGTVGDPNTARRGESFWHFAPRAWAGSFHAGWRAEAARGSPAYAVYGLGALAGFALALALGGGTGLLIWLALALHAQLQILLSDYVQHYGLTRPLRTDGRPAPVTPLQSWNAGHWASSALMLNATRHSDHHCHPARPYPALALPDAAPRLPWPMPVAAFVALIPPLWHRRMKPCLDALNS